VHYLNPEAQEFYRQYRDLFEFDFLEFLENPNDSDSIQYHREPCVILSAAGMVEGGRIQQHIRNNISNSKAAVLIAGFCAEGTLGHRLLQGQPTIAIKKKEMPVHAAIYKTDAFSAHPDSTGLLRYVDETMNPRLKKIFLVHGEEASMVAFKLALSEKGIDIAEIPNKGQTYEL
jgi:metallo-beta-lactamase family protein